MNVKWWYARIDLNVRIRIFVVTHIILSQTQGSHEYVHHLRLPTHGLSDNGQRDKRFGWQLSMTEISFLEAILHSTDTKTKKKCLKTIDFNFKGEVQLRLGVVRILVSLRKGKNLPSRVSNRKIVSDK